MTPDTPKISIAMTTFQGEKFLEEQLATFLEQSRLPDEIVIGDDGSTDGTWALLQDFAASSPVPVRLLRSDANRGLNRNIESVVAACSGSIIVLSDQDDYWARDKLAAVEAAFSDPAVTLWFSDAELVDSAGHPIGHTAWERVRLGGTDQARLREGRGVSRLVWGMTVTGATMAVRAKVVHLGCPLPPDLDEEPPLFLHDAWFAVLGALLGTTVVEPRPLTYYRQHTGQVAGLWRRSDEEGTSNAGLFGWRRRLEEARRRHAQLTVEHARVKLIADRIREADALGECRPAALEQLLGMEEYLAVRVQPPRTPARVVGVVQQWSRGRYGEYARGLRTAVADLVR